MYGTDGNTVHWWKESRLPVFRNLAEKKRTTCTTTRCKVASGLDPHVRRRDNSTRKNLAAEDLPQVLMEAIMEGRFHRAVLTRRSWYCIEKGRQTTEVAQHLQG
jgi:hypothetical protein